MFVTKSRYDQMAQLAANAQAMLAHATRLNNKHVEKLDALVTRINKLGGETFLRRGEAQQASAIFTADDVQRLILLCHPDRHDGKPMATEMTAKLLALKGSMK
jgi:hypothetical protein